VSEHNRHYRTFSVGSFLVETHPWFALKSLRGGLAMAILLTKADREYLEQLADRKMRPTKRQKARVLLGLAAGENVDSLSMRVGMTKEDLTALVAQFHAEGLKGIGLARRRHRDSPRFERRRHATVEKTPGVCGGDARIVGTRIPVWQLVEARNSGARESQLLIDFPRLTARNLVDAWAYADEHPEEITAAIHDNAVA
jgi:uncharacterized protein (DUF433 family)